MMFITFASLLSAAILMYHATLYNNKAMIPKATTARTTFHAAGMSLDYEAFCYSVADCFTISSITKLSTSVVI